MLRGKSRIFWRYSIAVLTVAIALLGKLLLNYWSGQLRETPFLLFFVAIMATSYYGGVGPGILAVVLSSFLGGYFFLTPAKSLFNGTTTRKYGGLGLGLAIVRHLVEMHHGRVYATSEGIGKGATFTVQLPIYKIK